MKHAWSLVLLSLCLAGCAPMSSQGYGHNSAAVETVSARARVHTELGAHYYARRQYPTALQELREALLADSGYAPVYNMLGLVHAALLEDKEADGHFRRALDLAPQYSEAHNNYGHFLCSRRRSAEAMQHFELAWKNPLYATPEKALANAGQCALLGGDLAEAERYAQRALIRAGNQPQALATMAEIQFRRGNAVMARSLLQKLEAQGGLDAAALWLGVRLERGAGNREAEANYGLQLRRNHPEAQETAWLLGGQYDMPGVKQ